MNTLSYCINSHVNNTDISFLPFSDERQLVIKTFHNVLFFAVFSDAVVGLSSNAYYISSTAEDVQVCVRVSSPSISCPITFPIDIFFNFTDETAG